jgi:hypothetical protein
MVQWENIGGRPRIEIIRYQDKGDNIYGKREAQYRSLTKPEAKGPMNEIDILIVVPEQDELRRG